MPSFNFQNPRENAINYDPRYDSKTLEDGSPNPEYQEGFFKGSDDDALSEWSSDFK